MDNEPNIRNKFSLVIHGGVSEPMSKKNWLTSPKTRLIGGLIIAVVAGGFILGYGHQKSAEYEWQSKSKSTEFSRYTRKRVAETCLGLIAVERAVCVYDAANAMTEYEDNQADLVAQRQSALWAYIMAFAAIMGMVLSAIGVGLIWTTFKETKKAADSSSKTYEAFVAVERARLKIGISGLSEYANGLGCQLTAWNIGKTSCVASFVGYLSLPDAVWPELGFPGNGRETPIKADEGERLINHTEYRKDQTFYLIGMVVYTSPFNRDHRTHFCVEIKRSDTAPHKFTPRMITAKGQPSDT